MKVIMDTCSNVVSVIWILRLKSVLTLSDYQLQLVYDAPPWTGIASEAPSSERCTLRSRLNRTSCRRASTAGVWAKKDSSC